MSATPTSRATLQAPDHALKLWLTTVGPDHAPAAVWAMPEGQILLASYDTGGAISRTTTTSSTGLQTLDLVQPLPDGRWLLVDSRAPFSIIDGTARNGVLVAWTGDHLADECLGDAIDHVVASTGGAIWTGYWDEATTGETPAQMIGASGLVRWSGQLEGEWSYDAPSDGSWIVNCDALTLDGERAVACVEAYLPASDEQASRVIVVDGDTFTDYAGGVLEAWGVLASGDEIAILGSADDDVLVTLGRLGDSKVVVSGTTRLDVDPDTLTARVCRGDTLHLFEGDRWSTLTLADLQADRTAVAG